MGRENIRDVCIWGGKVLLAGAIAFAALTLFCVWYYNIPVHSPCADGSTDYVREPHCFWSQAREGFGYGWTNNEGYYDQSDYIPAETQVNVLILGSSQMMAETVDMRRSTSSVLGEMLPGKTVYNLGMSGHYLLTAANNLPAAVEKYEPTDYVVVEIFNFSFDEESIGMAVKGEYPELISYNEGIIGVLQQNPFLRLIYQQMKSYMEQQDDADADPELPDEDNDDLLALSPLLSQMSKTVSGRPDGAKLVIVYHTAPTLNKDGTLSFPVSREREDAFGALCEENGILFLNMRDRFVSEYEQRHILPYGFANTSVGVGHLNNEGHQMMAEELYALMEEEGL